MLPLPADGDEYVLRPPRRLRQIGIINALFSPRHWALPPESNALDLRTFLFFAREGVVSQKSEDGQANQAGCLNLLTNAVIVWNTVYMQAALHAIR